MAGNAMKISWNEYAQLLGENTKGDLEVLNIKNGAQSSWHTTTYDEKQVRDLRDYLNWWLGKKADAAGEAKHKAEQEKFDCVVCKATGSCIKHMR